MSARTEIEDRVPDVSSVPVPREISDEVFEDAARKRFETRVMLVSALVCIVVAGALVGIAPDNKWLACLPFALLIVGSFAYGFMREDARRKDEHKDEHDEAAR